MVTMSFPNVVKIYTIVYSNTCASISFCAEQGHPWPDNFALAGDFGLYPGYILVCRSVKLSFYGNTFLNMEVTTDGCGRCVGTVDVL
jgi:hypothetical protein